MDKKVYTKFKRNVMVIDTAQAIETSAKRLIKVFDLNIQVTSEIAR